MKQDFKKSHENNNTEFYDKAGDKGYPEGIHFEDADVETDDVMPDEAFSEGVPGESEQTQASSELEDLKHLLQQKEDEVAKEKKEYMFLMAEFDNFRKRTLKEKSEIIKNAAESAMKGILPIVDDFERGIEANKTTDDPQALREGMELIYSKLVKYLEQNGVKAIESTGTEFNPDMHEAIAMVPAQDEESKGKIIDTPTKGYTINDKVLRHAKVVVAQ